MHSVTHNDNSDVAPEIVRAYLDRILSSPEFLASQRLTEFLRYVVEETLAGHGDRIKQTSIAIDVFGRDAAFDPLTDPVVRMQAAKLRRALEFYYLSEGRDDELRIEMPKGGYVPSFQWCKPAEKIEVPTETVATRVVGEPSSGPRLAVLPFVDKSGEPLQDHVIEGVSEGLSTALSQFDGLSIVAHRSAARFRDTSADVRDVGQELGADYLLSGSVRANGERVRIHAQLNRVDTDVQIWAQKLDLTLARENFFKIQDDVAVRLAASVGDSYGAIARAETQTSQAKDINELTVQEAILRGYHYLMVKTPDAHESALRAIEHAIMVDPGNVRAWAILAILYWDAYTLGFGNGKHVTERLFYCARRAISIDPWSQEAHFAMAILAFVLCDREQVMSSAEKILQINRNASYVAGAAGWIMSLCGAFDEGLPILRESMKLNPRYPTWFHLAPYLYHYKQGEYEAALREARQFGLPDLFWSPLLHAAALARLGRKDEAAAAYEQLQCLRPDFTKRARYYVSGLAMPDDVVSALLQGLRLAGDNTVNTQTTQEFSRLLGEIQLHVERLRVGKYAETIQ